MVGLREAEEAELRCVDHWHSIHRSSIRYTVIRHRNSDSSNTTQHRHRDAKAAILAAVGLQPQGQRLEVATRTRVTGPGLAMVAIEDHVTAPGLLTGEGEKGGAWDGGVERLLRYLRLKHLTASGLSRLGDGVDVGGEEGRKRMWARLASDVCGEWGVDARLEVAAGLEAVALCQEGLRRVGPQLERAVGVEEEDGGGGEGYRHRLGMVRTLLHGEVLALRAVAEFAMARVEAAEGE